ncbi:MAG TPA: hypothetical protein PKL73_10265 [Polyangiaceae bacterium]|nr:hypothetical protein [Polyangiaceae bacterium]HNZ23406.1 hypothetical protein [Polyangiaceae bacterium]HOD22783.1 hypothetical protein [Polyangiaceae bacterium]HOE49834.1 hypothetical protein [Polyangiaceae bacterium]HOH01660.1 hypothetical protein [Polyangiaceae bacterium]
MAEAWLSETSICGVNRGGAWRETTPRAASLVIESAGILGGQRS